MIVESYKPHSADELAVFELYHILIEAWNKKDARRFAKLFSGTAFVIGFDGSEMRGQAQIEEELKTIFSHHATGIYKMKVRDVTHLAEHCLLLKAISGMIAA